VALIAAVPCRLAQGDPAWLDDALGVKALRQLAVRALVGALYAQGVIIPALLALLVRQGSAVLRPFLWLELLAVVASALAALAAHRLRGRGVWLYAPVAVLVWAGIASLAAG